MRVLERRFRYKVGDRFRFVIFSDVHLGSRLCSLSNFKENLIDRYKNDRDAWFIDLGDCCDMIVAQTGDRRFRADMMDPSYVGTSCPIDRMVDDYCELVDPIKDRIIALCDSNHHIEIEKRTGTSPTRRIAAQLWGKDAENRLLGYAGFLVTHFAYEGGRQDSRTRTLTWALSHGVGSGGRTDGGVITSIGRVADDTDADISCYGHTHQLWGGDRVILSVDRPSKKVVSKKRIRINSGSYLKGYSDDASTSYVEEKMLRPNSLGHMELSVRLTRDAMETYHVKRMVL